MAKGLYFYKLVSPYKEDVTKDCKLTINEIDSNFISLKDMDIKSMTYDEDSHKIILTRNSKDELPLVADLTPIIDMIEGIVPSLNVEYHKKKGEIIITWAGKSFVIDGLVTSDNICYKVMTHVNSDSTLTGLGIPRSPLGINIVDRTGQYRPCIKYLNVVGGEILPKPCDVKKGDRYVTRECVSNYGFLYDFKAVREMEKDLKYGWRVPTKEDWDGMLNAVEPCECDRNHESSVCNREFGRFAGKVLKSLNGWDKQEHECRCQEDDNCRCNNHDFFDEVTDGCYHYNKECSDDFSEHHPKRKPCSANGVDKFGLTILPAGYGDGCELKNYLGKRAAFWTSTMIGNTDVYSKRFDYNKCGVVQIAADPHAVLSIRLVKDYDGSNFNEVEYINGYVFHCVLMPSLTAESGLQIWTINNVAFEDAKYCPEEVDPSEGAFEIQYFTCEWNGFNWVKKQLKEGDSVVLFEGKEEDEYAEYRVIKGELVSVTEGIYEDIYEKFEDFIQEINGRLNDEIETRENSDNVFSGAINELREEIDTTREEVFSSITEFSEKIYEFETIISGAVAEIEEVYDDIEELKDKVETLEDGQEELRNDLDALEQKEESDIETLTNALEEEIAARQEGDDILSGAVSEVADDLAAEIERAIEQENNIENRLISRGEYHSESGVLTLFTESGNTIEVQFNGNYGTF